MGPGHGFWKTRAHEERQAQHRLQQTIMLAVDSELAVNLFP